MLCVLTVLSSPSEHHLCEKKNASLFPYPSSSAVLTLHFENTAPEPSVNTACPLCLLEWSTQPSAKLLLMTVGLRIAIRYTVLERVLLCTMRSKTCFQTPVYSYIDFVVLDCLLYLCITTGARKGLYSRRAGALVDLFTQCLEYASMVDSRTVYQQDLLLSILLPSIELRS